MIAIDSTFDPTFDGVQPRDARGPDGAFDRSMLVHDIRGALQGVVGGVAALDAAHLPAGLREQCDRISAASRALESLVRMAIETPAAPDPAAETVLLDEFLDYLRDRWSGEAHDHGMGLVISRQADLPHGLRVPYVALARMLSNLTSNAIRHAGRGTVDVAFDRTRDGGLVARVADEGPGFPDAVLECRSPEAGTGAAGIDGHGLGLRIVRELAAEFGCDLTLCNRDHGGAEATLVFPPAVCIDEGGPDSRAGQAADHHPELAGLRVLLAEDNPTNQMVATQMLETLGVEVTVAADGVEALEIFEAGIFDLLLVDIEMPRLSGLDVIRRIRARGDARGAVPLLALTAYALSEHREQIAEAGADGLVSKPIVSVEALAGSLAAHVGRLPTVPVASVPAGPDAPEPEMAGPVVDRAVFDALTEAIGSELTAELLDKVISDLQGAQAELTAALSPLDRGPIRATSHILISVSGAIGATRLQACARTLHAAAQSSDYTELDREVRRCIAEIGAAVMFATGERGDL